MSIFSISLKKFNENISDAGTTTDTC